MHKIGSILGALVLFAVSTFAARNVIGVATTVGAFSVDESTVSGSVDIADGSKLQTTSAPSDIRLQNGGEVRLATRSAGTFFTDRVLLEEGAVRVSDFRGLTVNADQLTIAGDEPGAQAIVRMNRRTIEVASIGGAVNVTDAGLLTRIEAGTKMSFQTGASPATQPASTGAAPTPSKMPSDQKTFLWVIGITAVAALVIGLTAAAQGKSPF